jgi:hypothetical protein
VIGPFTVTITSSPDCAIGAIGFGASVHAVSSAATRSVAKRRPVMLKV